MIVEKSWGKETVFASTEEYCGKFLEFDEAGNKTSMHFHRNKDESLVVTFGSFKIYFFDLTTGMPDERVLRTGDTWKNPPLFMHQLEALESKSVLIEVSNANDPSDVFKINSEDA